MSRSERDEKSNIFSSRYSIIAGVILLLMLALCVRLFVVSILQHDTWSALAEDQSTKEITTAAARGNIYDRNGKLLAGNEQTFSVTFSASGMTSEELNSSAEALIKLFEENGDTIRDDFPIVIDENGKMSYTYDRNKKEWLEDQHFNTDLTAEEAFEAMRQEYEIDESLTRTEAYTELTETYGIYIPISVKTMVYVYDQQKTNFLSKWGCFKTSEIENGISARNCFTVLRERCKIPESMTDEEARKILLVRNKVATTLYQQYIPATLSKSVSEKTIAYIEEGGIPGASISSEYKRSYPMKHTASHILGYMGSISEETLSEYQSQGYASSDLIGQAGIESALESTLHGTAGVRRVRVNNSGQIVSTISETAPQKGKDVYLTIDSDLQKVAEKALADQIASAKASCQSGATVAMDVKTGEILAMASYPDFDPNIFAEGITTKAWESVQSKNPRDPISPAPLFNNATMAAAPPGSTFKPITALAGLRLGLDPNRYILDRGYIQIGDIKWKTSRYNISGGTEGEENLELGLGHSSNYYFYCVATGKDWGTGDSLGYSITIPDLLETAGEFGLGKKTGVEIAERVASVPTEENKINNYRISCWNYLYFNSLKFFPEEISGDQEALTKELDLITSWIEDDLSYSELQTRMREQTSIKENMIETAASGVKFDYFDQAKWTAGDQFNTGIGQGDNLYTPLQICTYCAALGNGAVYNQASLIHGIQGEGLKVESKKSRKIESVTEGQLAAVYKGLRYVCTHGSLASFFVNYECNVMGKTGTAENQGIPQPASEVDYIRSHLPALNARAGTAVTWEQVEKKMQELMKTERKKYPSEDDAVDAAVRQVSDFKITTAMINADKGSYDYYAWTMTLAPAEDPEIAVVTMLIQGGFSANAAPVNKQIMTKYFELYGGTSDHKYQTGSALTTDDNGKNAAQ